MIKLLIGNIMSDMSKLSSKKEHINNPNNKNRWDLILLTMSLCIVTKAVKRHDKKITDLEKEFKEMKSKGE